MSYSVVIPLYNHKKYIDNALRSVIEQTVPAREIIVVDDGSDDGGIEIVASHAAKDPRVIYWRQPNRGAHNAINAGLGRATSDIVGILNSDDIYMPKRMELALKHLASNPHVGAVYSGLGCIDDLGKEVQNTWYENAIAESENYDDLANSLLNANFLMTTSNLVFRRSVLDQVGYFSPLRYAHDLEFFARLTRFGVQLERLDPVLLRYRLHESNTIKESHDRVRVEWAFVIALQADWLSSRSGEERSARSELRQLLATIERHELGSLVQWFSWYCNLCRSRAVDPFKHRSLNEVVEAALELAR